MKINPVSVSYKNDSGNIFKKPNYKNLDLNIQPYMNFGNKNNLKEQTDRTAQHSEELDNGILKNFYNIMGTGLNKSKLNNGGIGIKADETNSRMNDGKYGPLNFNSITQLDDKLIVGRAPGNAAYIKNDATGQNEYIFDEDILAYDIEFLNSEFGITTIIDARNPKYEGADCIKCEREICDKKGVRYVNIPLDSAITPSEAQFEELIREINQSKGKTYIHCHAGKDRTGIMASYYLVSKGVTTENAFQLVFDNRTDHEHNSPIERLKFMRSPENVSELNKFLAILKKIEKKNTGK